MRPRLLLVKPPERSDFDFGAFSLATLAAAVLQRADVSIFDATSLLHDEAATQVWAESPDIVGITVMGISSVASAQLFIQMLCRHPAAQRALILAGGHGATGAPGPLVEAGADAVVMGEGEQTLADVLDRGVSPGAPGLAMLVDGELRAGPAQRPIEPLDRLPSPARHLMPAPRDGAHLMETSRGCPHLCAFCETVRFYGRKWRPHSPERVAAEAARLVDEHDAWLVLFADDNFAANSDRVIEICDRLAKGPLPATFMASARADDLIRDPAVIPALAAARILRLTVGVETLEPQPAATVHKELPLAMYKEVFERLADQGIFSLASFIVGLTGESPDPQHLLELAVDARPDAATFVPFVPMPGTPLAANAAHAEARPQDMARAAELTSAFGRNPIVRKRLQDAVTAGGVRGIMARAILERRAAGL